MDKNELKDILRMLTVVEKKMQKILYEKEKEQTECESECSQLDLKYLQNKAEKEVNDCFSSNHIEIEKELAEIKEIFLQFLKIEKIKLESRYGPRAK